MNIVLHEPEIPQNAGSIGRTCVATGARLHLIRPLGFIINSKFVKRAGMDYWNDVDISYYDSYAHFLEVNKSPRVFMATTKAQRLYTDVRYDKDDFIMFGKESAGIPAEILRANWENAVRIPMLDGKRSLNLSNSVSIVLYEALRQQNFENLNPEGIGMTPYGT